MIGMRSIESGASRESNKTRVREFPKCAVPLDCSGNGRPFDLWAREEPFDISCEKLLYRARALLLALGRKNLHCITKPITRLHRRDHCAIDITHIFVS